VLSTSSRLLQVQFWLSILSAWSVNAFVCAVFRCAVAAVRPRKQAVLWASRPCQQQRQAQQQQAQQLECMRAYGHAVCAAGLVVGVLTDCFLTSWGLYCCPHTWCRLVLTI
jgi:hypothetical protein